MSNKFIKKETENFIFNSLNCFRSFVTHDALETEQLGFKFGKSLALTSNRIVCFYGDLGTGKTTFIKGMAAGISGIDPNDVTSPTFSYLNIYEGDKTLYHFDLYRLKNSDQFLQLGFDEFFEAEGVCCIEWVERIAPLISSLNPFTLYHVEMSCLNEDSREINITFGLLNDSLSI